VSRLICVNYQILTAALSPVASIRGMSVDDIFGHTFPRSSAQMVVG